MWCWELGEVPVWLLLWSHWNIHQSHRPKVRSGKELFGVWVLWPQFEVSTVCLVERFYPAIFCYPCYLYFRILMLPYVFSGLFFQKNEALKWISFIYSLMCLILWTNFVMLIAQLSTFLRWTIRTAFSSKQDFVKQGKSWEDC